MSLVIELISHSKANHFSSIEMNKISFLLEKTLNEKVEVTVMDICKQPLIPGNVYHIQGAKMPSPRCAILEDMLCELFNRGLAFITKGKSCGGVRVSSGAQLIYKHILDGELDRCVNLIPRCSIHPVPCCSCESLATLYDQGGVKNVKMLEKLMRHLTVTKIMDKLF